MGSTVTSDMERLQQTFGLQKAAVARNPMPSLEQRLTRLGQLERMLVEHRQPVRDALQADFGSYHPWMSDLLGTGSVLGRVRHVAEHLAEWVAPRQVQLEFAHGAATAEVVQVPKGVNGVIGPWNLPIDCSLVMVADIFAAGNTAIVKPSELAPATAQVLDEAVSAHFQPETLAVVQGGPELAVMFASLPWDHLTYTGSARVGRLVAEAAAKNLVPLTLELGGKNPALFAPDGVTDELIERFLSFRALNGGQVCTSPDYALVPRDQIDRWVASAEAAWRRAYPTYVGHPDATGIINDAHYHRLVGYIDEARARGVRVVGLNDDEPDPARRQVPMTLVVDPPDDLGCMTDEVFGPVVPVVPYDSIDQAIARINAGPSPLGSYLATHDDGLARRFVTEVRSGGAAVNTYGLQGGQPVLPFGGIGASGNGCHSGREGFLNYSHAKSVFYAAGDSIVHQVVSIPLPELCGFVVDSMFKTSETLTPLERG
jgi:coniferyl-aldehyde dehydrogenase